VFTTRAYEQATPTLYLYFDITATPYHLDLKRFEELRWDAQGGGVGGIVGPTSMQAQLWDGATLVASDITRTTATTMTSYVWDFTDFITGGDTYQFRIYAWNASNAGTPGVMPLSWLTTSRCGACPNRRSSS